jgi:hypothetical protein
LRRAIHLQSWVLAFGVLRPTALRKGCGYHDTANKGWLSGFRAAKAKEDRSFRPLLKKALVSAGKLADRMTATRLVGSARIQ